MDRIGDITKIKKGFRTFWQVLYEFEDWGNGGKSWRFKQFRDLENAVIYSAIISKNVCKSKECDE